MDLDIFGGILLPHLKKELKKLNKYMVGREMKLIEMKKEIRKLKKQKNLVEVAVKKRVLVVVANLLGKQKVQRKQRIRKRKDTKSKMRN